MFSAAKYANFTKKLEKEGVHVHFLFDDTVWPDDPVLPKSNCSRPCTNQSVPSDWCCGSIDEKIRFVDEVRRKYDGVVEGVNFDIEGLNDIQYLNLFQTASDLWNPLLGAERDLGFNMLPVFHAKGSLRSHWTR